LSWLADIHVHSRHSRATARDCDLEHLAREGARKGLAVVGSGDFTHPAWRKELGEKLIPAEPGLFRLTSTLEEEVAAKLPPLCRRLPRFLLSVEISTIYKADGATRKVHHLICAPDFETVDRLTARLARIGNLSADGRPILGLDSRDLLEITLEAGPGAFLIPAHIWTPWFSMLGSRSGFDSVEACYRDLAPHIFALETGLSSDPAMNWRVSALDRYRLVSHSDAHSPAKLGREATRYAGMPDYFALRRALETGAGYLGTVEFFPEEGKYHLDGHRKCEQRLTPEETRRHGGRCPCCGGPVTVGVEHRVAVLADRPPGTPAPATGGAVSSLIPLREVLAELNGGGEGGVRVERSYDHLLSRLGAELDLLESVPLEEIARHGSALLAEGLRRLRAGQVRRDPGYDGEYGVIRLFADDELQQQRRGGLLFERTDQTPPPARRPRSVPPVPLPVSPPESGRLVGESSLLTGPVGAGPVGVGRGGGAPLLAGLDEAQRAAAAHGAGPLLILAGPGSGKTRTLTHRLAHLVVTGAAAPESCLAITFTRRAAGELRERLAALVPEAARAIAVHTFHSLGLAILRAHAGAAGLASGWRLADERERTAALAAELGVSERTSGGHLAALALARRTQTEPPVRSRRAAEAYQALMTARNWIAFDDLIDLPLRLLAPRAGDDGGAGASSGSGADTGTGTGTGLAALWQRRFTWISVDEVQDIDESQVRFLRLLAPSPTANLCAIGDPDQAIYGFRGADRRVFTRLRADYPGLSEVHLRCNYRSGGTIVAAASQMIAGGPGAVAREMAAPATAVRARLGPITVHVARSPAAEAEFVVQTLERLIGGHSFFSIDSGRGGSGQGGVAGVRGAAAALSFADFAVLARTTAQLETVATALERGGIPCQCRSEAPLADDPAVARILAAFDTGCGAGTGAGAGAGAGCGAGAGSGSRPETLVQRLRTAAARVETESYVEHRGGDEQTGADLSGEEGPGEGWAGEGRAGEERPGKGRRRGRLRTGDAALERLLALAAGMEDAEPGRFVEAARLAIEADTWDARADRVSLLTLHAAKGLEFPVVFVLGLEDGVLPLRWGRNQESDDAAVDLDEERRLFYVGMTRARDQLVLCRCEQRAWQGRTRALPASPFLAAIDGSLLAGSRTGGAGPDRRQLILL